MKRIYVGIALVGFSLLTLTQAIGQEAWSLRKCIDYARENNLQVQASEVNLQSSKEDLQEAKAQKVPSLSFSTTQGATHQKKEQQDGSFASNGTYSGNYALNAGITIYNGGKLNNTLRQQEVVLEGRGYQIAMARNDIEIAVTQAYLNILYANESVKINRQTVETSLAQRDRSKVLLEAGSISPSDFAQMESQYSSDKYQLTVSENLLAQRTLVLRQLLELELEDRFAIDFPELSEGEVLASIPELASVYRDALEVMPQIDNSAANIRSAQVNEQIAKAAGLPSLTASAAIGTGNISGTNYSFYNQLNHKLNENIGLTLSVPIFNNRRAKTSIAKARLQTKQAEIEHQSVEKELLSTIESLYQDAVSAQSRYISATDKVHAATVSYQLVSEQFNAGMKNTVELLTEKNTYLSAQLEQTQAKYQAVLSIKLLNFYRNQPINL